MGIKTVFMGTPDFSKTIAQALVDNGFDVVGVVTQPDKKSGRGNKVHFSPVKIWAEENGIPVYQPERARNPEFIETIRQISPELIITAAIGQIIPKEILDMPKYGCVNIHASILPKYRGASPIQQALFDAEKTTGITVMYMSENIDDGDIILTREIPILPDDNTGTLFEKLAQTGAEAISDYAELIKNGKPTATPQNHALATYCKKIDKEQGNIDWAQTPDSIVNTVKAMSPSPGAYSFLNGKRIKIINVKPRYQTHEHSFGTIIVGKGTLSVACNGGFIDIIQLQPEGKSIQQAKDFLNGNKLTLDSMFERKIN